MGGFSFKKMVMNIERVFWFCLQFLSEIFIILRRIQRDIVTNVYMPSSKLETWVFSTYFRKIDNIKFMKIRPVGAKLFHADAVTDSTKLIVVFHNFASASKRTPVLYIFLKIHPNTFIVVSLRAKLRQKAELWSAQTPCCVDTPSDRPPSNSRQYHLTSTMRGNQRWNGLGACANSKSSNVNRSKSTCSHAFTMCCSYSI